MCSVEFITLDRNNLANEHICCSMSDKKGEHGNENKKKWLEKAFDKGLVFRKADVRGKVFIEYIPAENAWCPIEAEGYMFINCFWVSGQFKGTGIGSRLLKECIEDSKKKGKRGIVVVSSPKKMPYLSDPKFLKNKGFTVCDKALPYFELLCLKFDEGGDIPRFKDYARNGICNCSAEVAIYYSSQCPYTDKYVKLVEKRALEKSIDIVVKRYEYQEEAQKAPVPCTSYSVFIKGKFVTNEILTVEKFDKLLGISS